MATDSSICNNSYLPNSDQYFTALQSFGSSIVIVGGLITLGLFILFLELVVFTLGTAHPRAKRHIIWIASVFPVMTLMSLVSLLIPRAENVCLSVKMVYMSIGISHFSDLTMVMFGGEEMFVERANGEFFKLRTGPLCCCCRCLPNTPVTKYSLRLVCLLTDQFPFMQSAYYVIVMILLAADNIQLGDVKPSGAFLWLNLMKTTSAMFGIFGFKILSDFAHSNLHGFEYWKKSRSITILLIITNFQSMIFNILANYNVFPCYPPYISPSLYKQTLDNAIYILEMLILGPYTFWQYHDQKFSAPIESFRDAEDSYSINSGKDSNPAGTVSTAVTVTPANSDFDDDDFLEHIIGIENERTRVNESSRESSIRRGSKSLKGSSRSSVDKMRRSKCDMTNEIDKVKGRLKTKNRIDRDTSKPSHYASSEASTSRESGYATNPASDREREGDGDANSSITSSTNNTADSNNANCTPSLLDRALSLAPGAGKTRNDYERF